MSLSLKRGAITGLIGPNGAGKTTLFNTIAGALAPSSGTTHFEGQPIHGRPPYQIYRCGIARTFQIPRPFGALSVLENVMLAPRKVRGLSAIQAEELAVNQLSHVGLRDKLKVFPGKLSGGQLQRMAIARALAMSPDYMLFDEVTSALDPQLVGEVLDTLRMLSDEGMTMVLVTHEIRFARDVSDRVAFFRNGVIHELGSPQQVIDDPQRPETAEFLKSSH